MQVTRIEGGLGVALPASVIEAFNLHEGDEVDVSVTPVRPARDPAKIREALIRLRKYRGTLPKDFRFDREEANARG